MNKPTNVGLKRKSDELQDESKWNVNDKLALLKALKKYEHTDIESISKMLPDKRHATIKNMIDKLMTNSKTMKGLVPINDWLESGLFKDDSVIPLALHFIQLFEKHPPSEPGKCDYSSIYQFLYCLILGKTTPELQLESKTVLYSALNSVMEEVWPNSQNQILEYVGKLHKKRKIRKVYGGKKKSILHDDNGIQ